MFQNSSLTVTIRGLTLGLVLVLLLSEEQRATLPALLR